jgi:hypothetical protein
MMNDTLGPLPEPANHGHGDDDVIVFYYTADQMRAYALAEVAKERERIANSLRRSGATLPAPEVKGTPESGIITGLCIALTLVTE